MQNKRYCKIRAIDQRSKNYLLSTTAASYVVILGFILAVIVILLTIKSQWIDNEHLWRSIINDNEVPKYRLVCYYYFPGTSESLQINNIDPELCTHINVAFASVVNSTLNISDSQEKYLKDMSILKQKNKNLKILLSVGGAGNGGGYPEMVFNHSNRKMFIKSVLNYADMLNLDGIDLDWEYPALNTTGDKRQKIHFSQLLYEIRKAVLRRPKKEFLITVAVAATTDIVDMCYDVAFMNQQVDYINLMSYDYHFFTSSSPFTGINSPLYQSAQESFFLATLNINYSAWYWESLGMDRDKINIGLPTYGHTFHLINPSNNGLYAPASDFGELGSLGFADYPQICKFISDKSVCQRFDNATNSPYAFKDHEWVSFDNPVSLTYKTEFVRTNKFGGVMVYSLNSDDFRGSCENNTFPLIRSIKEALFPKKSSTR